MPQENNMAELLRLMKTVIVKVDGLEVKVDDLATNMKDVKSDVKELKTRTVRIEGKVDRLDGKIDSIADTVMKNDRRLIAVERDVSDLQRREHSEGL